MQENRDGVFDNLEQAADFGGERHSAVTSDTDDAHTKKDGAGEEKLFTQEKLEEILAERLARERKNRQPLLAVKRLLKQAAESGIIKGSSYSELAGELMAKLSSGDAAFNGTSVTEGNFKNNRGEFSSDAAAVLPKGEDGTGDGEDITPGKGLDAVFTAEDFTKTEDKAEANSVLENGNDTVEKSSEEVGESSYSSDEQGGETERFIAILSHITEGLNEKQIKRMFSSGSLEKFAKGRSGTTVDIVKDYCDFITSLDDGSDNYDNRGIYTPYGGEGEQVCHGLDDENDVFDGTSQDLASTAFCVHSGVPSHGTALTRQQMEIAKSAGMSYREYASLLETIPKKKSSIR